MQKGKKTKVLLVDDEKVFAQTLAERLQTRNVASRAVFGGNEAMADIEKEEPDVLILDLKMPDMDGMEVLRRVRAKHPGVETIILTGHGSAEARDQAYKLGAAGFFDKPVDLGRLVQKINGALKAETRPSGNSMYSYRDFTALLKQHLDRNNISLGENALGIKCFCRDDNQDQIGSLLAEIGQSSGWFDLNSFGAYPAGRSFESLGPPAHHVPDIKETPWIVLVHATHVGCDSVYTLGVTDRYGMRQPSSSCGLLAKIIERHRERRDIRPPVELKDFEMKETEKALMPYLDAIVDAEYPMATIAGKLLDLGHELFDPLLRDHTKRSLYIGGINVDYVPGRPEKNLFVPQISCIYENGQKTEIALNA